MNILRRRVPAVEAGGREIKPAVTVHQRIEVTVEREVVSVLMRGGRKVSAEKQAGVASEPEPGLAELPLPQKQKGGQ